METNMMLTMRDIRKTYASGFTVGPVQLELERGLVYAVVGPNGSGKSTLLRMMLNLVKPTEGRLRVLGLGYPDDEIAIKERIAYAAEEDDRTFTGLRNAEELVRFIRPWYPRWNETKWRELVLRFDLDLRAKLGTMSKGTKGRLALALALAHDPELLLLDEPSSGLDPLVWRVMMGELQQFLAGGDRTIVIATHNMEEVRRLADYVVFMHMGRLLGSYEKDALVDGWKAVWTERPLHEAVPGGSDAATRQAGGNGGIAEDVDPTAAPEVPRAVQIGPPVTAARGTGAIPGLVHVDPELPTRLVTSDYAATERALRELGIGIGRTQALELDEIFEYMVSRSMQG